MATRKLDKSEWQRYFDRVSRQLGAEQVEIDIMSPALGAQVEAEAEHAVLNGVSYDPHDDVIDVITENIDHRIAHPRELYVEETAEGLHSIQAVDADGNKQVVTLRSPMQLPAPGA